MVVLPDVPVIPITVIRWDGSPYTVAARPPSTKTEIETVRAGMLRTVTATVAGARRLRPTGPIDDLLLPHLVAAILNLLAWWLRNLWWLGGYSEKR